MSDDVRRVTTGGWVVDVPVAAEVRNLEAEGGSIIQFHGGDADVLSVSVLRRSTEFDPSLAAPGTAAQLADVAGDSLHFDQSDRLTLPSPMGGDRVVHRVRGERRQLPVVQLIAAEPDGDQGVAAVEVMARQTPRGEQLAEAIVRSFESTNGAD